ncbi:MAG TPA: hypothetical protein VJW55_19535 [Candidatus Angelobacter sp.]|nr:hypothetical protein [Candidatus Angelobacter sp.]
MTDAEYEEYKRQEELAKERVRQEAAMLMNQLAQTYEALTRLLQQNADVGREVTDRTEAEEEIYRKLRNSLQRANQAPRCRWVRQDGTGCGSPQVRKHIYCYAHKQMMESRALALRLPALEDANAIQISLMRVQKALIDDTITAKKAGLLLYSLQLAMTNVGQTTFGEAEEQELVTELVDEEEAISSQHSAFNPTTFTTEGTEKSGEEPAEHVEKKIPGRGLPRINAEERGLESFSIENADGKGVEKKGVEKEIPKVIAMRAGGDD